MSYHQRLNELSKDDVVYLMDWSDFPYTIQTYYIIDDPNEYSQVTLDPQICILFPHKKLSMLGIWSSRQNVDGNLC